MDCVARFEGLFLVPAEVWQRRAYKLAAGKPDLQDAQASQIGHFVNVARNHVFGLDKRLMAYLDLFRTNGDVDCLSRRAADSVVDIEEAIRFFGADANVVGLVLDRTPENMFTEPMNSATNLLLGNS